MPRPSFQAILRSFVVLFALTMVTLALRGYVAYRVDHVTQVPMLMRWIDPSLYSEDWFLAKTVGHYPVRKVFLTIELLLYKVIPNVPLVLFTQYLLYIAAAVGALQAIARRQGQGTLFVLIWLALIATSNEFANLSKTQMIEEQTVPRMYSYVGVLWAIPLLMGGHSLAAGLLMGLTGLVQAAPPMQMMPLFVIWMLLRNGPLQGLKHSALMLVGFGLTFWPNFLILGDVVKGENHFTPEQVIHFSAFLRHPHHMLPLEFTTRDYLASAVLLGMLLVWHRSGKIDPKHRPLLTLLLVIVGFLLVAPIFIHAIPIAAWVEFQPYRTYATFRIIFYFFMTIHLLSLLRSSDPPEVLRAGLLLLAFWKSPEEPQILGTFLGIELLMMLLKGRLRPETYGRCQLVIPSLAILVWGPEGTTRMLLMQAAWWTLLLRQPLYARVDQLVRRVAAWPGLPNAAAGAGLAFLLALLLLPFKASADNPAEWSKLRLMHQAFTNRYQVYPYPEHSLEFAAVWAKEHTPEHALFIIPADRAKESFQVWSERSTVFNVKTFPYLKSEWPQWIDRYQKMTGVLDPKDFDDVEIVMDDKGTARIDGWFASMDGATLVAVMRYFGADYVVSPAEHLLTADDMVEVVAGPFYNLEDLIDEKYRYPLYIFKIADTPAARSIVPPPPAQF